MLLVWPNQPLDLVQDTLNCSGKHRKAPQGHDHAHDPERTGQTSRMGVPIGTEPFHGDDSRNVRLNYAEKLSYACVSDQSQRDSIPSGLINRYQARDKRLPSREWRVGSLRR